METALKEATQARSIVTAAQERRPFLRLDPRTACELPASARPGLPILEARLADELPGLVHCLVNHGIEAQHRQSRSLRRVPPSVSLLNRRRRAARQWLLALLSGKVDADTLHEVGHSLLPQLAGTGPDRQTGVAQVRECVEYLRGAAVARLFDAPADNLVPNAKALHALETLLAIHLDAYQQALVALPHAEG